MYIGISINSQGVPVMGSSVNVIFLTYNKINYIFADFSKINVNKIVSSRLYRYFCIRNSFKNIIKCILNINSDKPSVKKTVMKMENEFDYNFTDENR